MCITKPSLKHHREIMLNWFNTLWQNVQKFPTHKTLLGGDFNIQCESNHYTYKQMEAGSILLQFLSETELTDCWSVLHPDTIRYTYYGLSRYNAVVASRIDYFFASPLSVSYLHSCEIGIWYQSDHCPLEVNLLMHRNS